MHQLRRRGHRLVVGRLVVHLDELDLVGLAADLDGRLLGIGVFHAERLLLSAGAVVAGCRLENTDLDNFFIARRAAAARKAQAAQRRRKN